MEILINPAILGIRDWVRRKGDFIVKERKPGELEEADEATKAAE
jgi:hypothetical protein